MFQYLLDWHRDWYVNDGAERHTKQLFVGSGGEWRLTSGEKKRILLNNVYGVDIDAQAVETTKLSLLLKVLEGETSETINSQLSFLHERALPDLADNIKCGNSLIGPNYLEQQTRLVLDDGELETVNVFDWERSFAQILRGDGQRGFDAVVGNPPYVRVHRLSAKTKDYLWQEYTSFIEKGDLYACFIERALALLRPGGYLSFITPNTWSSLQSFRELRRIVLERSDIIELVRTPPKVFRNATVRTFIFVLKRRGAGKPRAAHRVLDMDQTGRTALSGTVRRDAIEGAHQFNLLLFGDGAEPETRHQRTVEQEAEFAYGFKTGDDDLFLTDAPRGGTWLPFCRSADVRCLEPMVGTGWVDYRPDAMRAHRRTARPGELSRFIRPKVVVARMGRSLVVTFDDQGMLVKDAMILLSRRDSVSDLKLLAGLLSSNFLKELYTRQFVTIDVLKNALLSLPLPGPLAEVIRTPEGSEIAELVEQMIHAHAASVVTEAAQMRIDYLAERLYSATSVSNPGGQDVK